MELGYESDSKAVAVSAKDATRDKLSFDRIIMRRREWLDLAGEKL